MERDIHHLVLANELADLTDEHVHLTRGIVAEAAGLQHMRNIARKFSHQKMAELVLQEETNDNEQSAPVLKDATLRPSEDPPKTSLAIPKPVIELQRKLFHRHPSAVVARMVEDGEIHVGETTSTSMTAPALNIVNAPVATDPVRDAVVKFFDANPDFNIREKSIAVHLAERRQPQDRLHPAVVDALKTLQTTQAVTHTPEALPALSKAGMISAMKVVQVSEKSFVSGLSEHVGGQDVARAIHAHASNIVIRNSLALTAILQNTRGTGIAMIDGATPKTERISMAIDDAAKQPEQVNLEALFGPIDICECDDCGSVTSPAAYFVELLQFLRNDNLNPYSQFMDKPLQPGEDPRIVKGQKEIQDKTPLGVLLARRPDLAGLELTCANTNTVLPYIDLANEVMESFVVHLATYSAEVPPRKAILTAFNADPETTEGLGGSTAELLAQPQNTDYEAYCILANAVYPSTKLPFNQPVEAIRLFLQFLGTNRADLGERFRGQYVPPTVTTPDPLNPVGSTYLQPEKQQKRATVSQGENSTCSESERSHLSSSSSSDREDDEDCPPPQTTEPGAMGAPISTSDRVCLSQLHQEALDRANDAERLLLTEEEYIILTKEAFWVKKHFEILHGANISDETYRDRIGLRKDWEYWGVDYANVDDMLDDHMLDDQAGKGLTFVKKQFLPRTGILYSDVVDLLRTEFINPNMPKGRDKVIMETFRLSYKFLKSLVGPGKGKERFWPIVQFIDSPAWHRKLGTTDGPDIMEFFDVDEDKEKRNKCRHHHPHHCTCKRRKRILKWLYLNFDRFGHIIVLESLLDAPHLPWEALIGGESVIGKLGKDGIILDYDGKPESVPGNPIGYVKLDGTVMAFSATGPLPHGTAATTEIPWRSSDFRESTFVMDLSKTDIGEIDENSKMKITDEEGGAIPWVGLGDNCDISNDRLRHLDGGKLTVEEYDRIHRFLRLWRKLGWTMEETDAALRVLGVPKAGPVVVCPTPSTPIPTPDPNTGQGDVDWIDFSPSCTNGKCGKQTCNSCSSRGNSGNPTGNTGNKDCDDHHAKKTKPGPPPLPQISPEFLHQLAALKKLAELTGLEILNLLTFWGTITTAGKPSLYSQLFLTHNLRGIDQVFVADSNGNYLAASPAPKIRDHVPILLASLQIKIQDFYDLIRTIIDQGLDADLTLENVSTLYRYVLLGRVFSIKPARLPTIFTTLDLNPFVSAETALELVELWTKISDAGFDFPNLYYVFKSAEKPEIDPLHPVGPSPRTLLEATMTLYTGLNDIEAQHPDIDPATTPTSAVVLQNAQLIFAPEVAARIVGFLEGKLIFETLAPAGLVIAVPTELTAKLKYADGIPPTLQITGQLTDDESQKAKALSANPDWVKAINRCARRAATFLRTTLSGIFPSEEDVETKKTLLTGDIGSSNDTAPGKRQYFLKWFIPFLRRKLADKLVIDTLSGATSLDPLIGGTLLTTVIFDTSDPTKKTSALDALEKIKNDPAPPTDSFRGYVIPDTTDTYAFGTVAETQPTDMLLDGAAVTFKLDSASDDDAKLWLSDPLRLTGGRLYAIELNGLLPKDLSWKTERTQLAQVPPSSVLANHVTTALTNLFVVLYKCAIVINGFSLTLDEVEYFQSHKSDFDEFDWNTLTLRQWKRLADYAKLKSSLPKLDQSLINLLTWASGTNANAENIAEKVKNVTLWDVEDVKKLISASHFNLLSPADFKNEINLIKIQKALEVSTKIQMPIDLLFVWAQPRIDFWKTHNVAESIRTAIRARYKLSDWEIAIKPTYDQLRQLQSNALTAYLINQPVLKEEGVFDTDGLFEFFLIDTQMCPCMETARLKQATSSVQLFVQRCFLGLEKVHGIEADMLDRGRWDWMQRYRVWEANRKVFLYPENWIQPSLRDDKSPIYQQLESELMQRDLTSSTILDAIKNFLFKLDEVANLEVDAIHFEDPVGTKSGKLHVFARTRSAPYKFYYRSFDLTLEAWTPWQDMAVDIPRYEVEKDKKPGTSGATVSRPSMAKPGGFYLVPFTFNSRLLVAIPQFMKVQLIAPVPQKKMSEIGNNANADESMPTEYWEIKMGLSELRNGKWTAKQVTSETIQDSTPYPSPFHPHISYRLISVHST